MVAGPVDPLRREALADPVLRLVREGALACVTYDEAWDAADALFQEGAYIPPAVEVQDFLRNNWLVLLKESAQPPGTATKRGRPTLLTPSLLEQIAAAAEDGVKDPQIYAELGIAKQTWARWLELQDFRDALAAARARLARRLMRLIPTMEKGWQAPVWVLTQLFPGDYSRPNAETSINVNASASAIAETQVKVSLAPEKVADLTARRRRQLEKQMQRAMAAAGGRS